MEKVNILFLTIDCLRYDRIHANGYAHSTTPNIDRFLKEDATNFTQTIAAGPGTMAAFPALFTSSYPIMYGGTKFLSEDRSTLSEILTKQGYTTIGLSSNPYITPEFGYDRGFTEFWDSVERTRNRDRKINLLSKFISRDSKTWNLLRKIARRREVQQQKALYPSAEQMRHKLNDSLVDGQEPTFIWCHFMDLHYPYNLPAIKPVLNNEYGFNNSILSDILARLMKESNTFTKEQRNIVNKIYDTSLHYIDEQLGILFDQLKSSGNWDNTLIILTADHGEELIEQGRFGHGDEGVESSFSEELLRIPLMIKFPGAKHGRSTFDTLISQLDIPATIIDFLGIDLPANWYGKSVLPVISGASPIIHDAAITQRGIERSFSLSWRTEKWKFIFNAFTQEKKLFDINNGRGDNKNLITEFPDVATDLYNQITDHLNYYQDAYTKERLEGVQIDDELKNRLEALGYM